MGSKELPNWVRWPQGEAGFQALAIRIDKPVDDVFQLIYGSETNFAVRLGFGAWGDEADGIAVL